MFFGPVYFMFFLPGFSERGDATQQIEATQKTTRNPPQTRASLTSCAHPSGSRSSASDH